MYLDSAFVASESDVTAVAFTPQYSGYIKIWKVAVLLKKLGVSADDFAWTVAHGAELGLLDLNGLPVAPTDTTPSPFDAFERWLDLVQLKADLPKGEPELFALLGGALAFDPESGANDVAEQDFLVAFAAFSGWPLSELVFLAGSQALNLQFPRDYRNGRGLRRLAVCFEMMKRIGVEAQRLASWGGANVSQTDALEIKAAVRSRFDYQQWLATVQPISDTFREKRRDALSDFLVGHRAEFRDRAALFAHFLIDPDMGRA